MNTPKKRRLLFSVTIRDCDVQTFRGSGPGGQHRNKVATAVRVRHRASGAVGECQEHRSQHQNKKLAFERMAKSKKFQSWNRMEAARLMGEPTIDELVDAQMQPANIRMDVRDDAGRWQTVEKIEDAEEEAQ